VRSAFIASGVLFLMVVAGFVYGFASTNPLPMVLSMTCGSYLFIAALASGVTRLILQYELTPKETTVSRNGATPPKRIRRQKADILN